MPFRRTLLLPTTVTLLALAACGDDGGGDGGEADAIDATGDVTIELTDNVFSPDTVETASGETVTVALENTGSVAHTFTGDDFDEELAPGESTTVSVDIPAGDDGLGFFCRFHQDIGMTGEFTNSGASPENDDDTHDHDDDDHDHDDHDHDDEPDPDGGVGY